LAEIEKFVATISHQGDMRVIVVPKRLHKKLEMYEGSQVKITIEEI
jgi:antitoxin component of MazEF toxin-antitoxin module